jgi:hypothetical protein
MNALDIRAEILRRMTVQPQPGRPVAELSDQAKLMLARVAGVPIQMDVVDGMLTQSANFAIADSGRGSYLIGWVNARDELVTVEVGLK